MAFLSSCLRTFLFVFVLPLLLLLFAPGIPPHDLEFEDETVFAERKVRLEGALAPNARLDEAEDLTAEVAEGVSLGMLKGPESFAAKDGYLYTGIQVRTKRNWSKCCCCSNTLVNLVPRAAKSCAST